MFKDLKTASNFNKASLLFPTSKLVSTNGRSFAFPMSTWLADVVKTEYPDLHASIQSKNIKDQFETIAKEVGCVLDSRENIESLSLYLLIQLKYGSLLETVKDHYPEHFEKVSRNNAQKDPVSFTVALLEQFDITEKKFPECYEALRTVVTPPRPTGQG